MLSNKNATWNRSNAEKIEEWNLWIHVGTKQLALQFALTEVLIYYPPTKFLH
jgi:hypothetical protein